VLFFGVHDSPLTGESTLFAILLLLNEDKLYALPIFSSKIDIKNNDV